jgi:hypothetical protein
MLVVLYWMFGVFRPFFEVVNILGFYSIGLAKIKLTPMKIRHNFGVEIINN